MVANNEIKVKRYVYEMANSYMGYGELWQQRRINRYVRALESGLITHRECVKEIVKTIEDMGKHYKFADLSRDAQNECIDQYFGVVCPYDDEQGDWHLDGMSIEEIEDIINLFQEASDTMWFDESGNWYDEGTKVVTW